MSTWRNASQILVILSLVLGPGCTPLEPPSVTGQSSTPSPSAATVSQMDLSATETAATPTVPTVLTPTPDAASALALTVSAQPAREGPFSLVLTKTGVVRPASLVGVAPKVAGRIDKLMVDAESKVKAGDVLASLDRGPLEQAAKEAQINLDSTQNRFASFQAGSRPEEIALAEVAVANAETHLSQVKSGTPASEIAAAEANVTAARSTLENWRAELSKLKQMPTSYDLREAELSLERAYRQRLASQLDRDGVCGNHDNPQYQCDSANSSVAAVETVVSQAKAAYEKVKAGARPEDIAAAEKAVVNAEAQLRTAEARLAELKAKPTEEEVAVASNAVTQAKAQLAAKRKPYADEEVKAAQIQVAQAELALAKAKGDLAEANVLAPLDGIVTQKILSEKSVATPQSPILVVSSLGVEVAITVEEEQANLLETGQPATMTVADHPQQVFSAVVTSIVPSADFPMARTSVVKLAASDSEGGLRNGMSAEVKIVARQRANALLVPKPAVVQRSGKSVVFVVVGDKVAEHQVKTGLADGQQIEIVSGVAKGDMIVTSGQSGLRDGDSVRVTSQSE